MAVLTYTPKGIPLTNRAATTSGKLDNTATKTLEVTNTAIKPSSNHLRDSRPVVAASSGAPTTAPRVKAVTTQPAEPIAAAGSVDQRSGSRSRAMSGNRPPTVNKLMPMAKPPNVSAARASTRRTGVSESLIAESPDALCGR
jgi:hypothetical protein